MSVLDTSLLKAGPYGTGTDRPATIAGLNFLIDPSSVQLPIRAKMQKFRTLGGFVVQVYGTTWGDLTVTGQFGTGGWEAQVNFLEQMYQVGINQAMQRQATVAGQNFTPSQPFRFTYPLLGWDFLCYLKDYTSPDGPMAVHMSNVNINPKWALTLFIVTDNSSLTALNGPTKKAYLQRLAPGLGVMWNATTEKYQGYQMDQYNAQLTNTDLQDYINNPKTGGTSDVVSAVPSTNTGPTGAPGGTGSDAGQTGKSVVPVNANQISNPNQFSVAMLSYMNIVPGYFAVGTTDADNDVKMLNAQQAQEGMWTAYAITDPRNANNMHNPLNINAPNGYGYGYSYNLGGGTGSFPTWAQGVQGTAENYLKGYPAAVAGLQAANFNQWIQGVVAGGWVGSSPSNQANYVTQITTLYKQYGGT